MATDRPYRYLIPAEAVTDGLLARIDGRVAPVAPRAAATIVLAREALGGPEVLLLRRPTRSAFAASAWVFPGGVVDEGDAAAGPEMLGPPADDWARRLGTRAEVALAAVAAALREAWEETGILLADPPPDPPSTRAARIRLLAGDLTLADALASLGSRLDTRAVVYIAHWITPEPEPRRYDTRFFLAALPHDARCDLLGDELTEARWFTPTSATRLYASGELRLLPPTVHTLHRLEPYGSAREMVQALRSVSVPTIVPRMRRDARGVVIEIPES